MEDVVIIVLVIISAVEGIFLKRVIKKYRKKELKEQLLEEIIQGRFKNTEKDINVAATAYNLNKAVEQLEKLRGECENPLQDYGGKIMKNVNNIANTTGRVTYQQSPTKISPDMEQLYFELEDKDYVFQIGIKTILECILFGVKENQLPNLPLSWYTEVCSRYDIPLSELFGED